MRRQRVYRESGPERHWGHPKTKAFLLSVLCLLFVTLCVPAIADEPGPPTLPLGASAPDFCLPGIDGQTHCLKDYAGSKVLVVAFTCNHCPTAQLYESRIKQLAADYRDRGVALVAIQPNNPNAVRLDEMGYTDVGDSFEEMKLRAAYRHFNFPYLYDGDTQKVSRDYGPSATPHLFIFDAERKLRYQGRVDNNPRESLVTSRDARNAIDAILARSEEHTSELQSRRDLVCRLLLEKKNTYTWAVRNRSRVPRSSSHDP